jgi:hypothetical protein
MGQALQGRGQTRRAGDDETLVGGNGVWTGGNCYDDQQKLEEAVAETIRHSCASA